MTKSLVLLGVLGMLSACNKVDEMQNTTNKMAETTEQMNNKMSETNKKINETNNTTKDTVRIVRPGGSLDARNTAIRLLKDADNLGDKLAFGAKYFYAFEYQYWTLDIDTREARDVMKGLATEEFYKTVQQFTKTAYTPLAPETQNLYAIAATLHEVDAFQKVAIAQAQVPETSMLSMIEEALRSKKLIQAGQLRGKQISVATSTILDNEETSVKLLQKRQSFLLLLALCRAYDLGQRRIEQILTTIFLERRLGKLEEHVELRLEEKNVIQVQWQNRYLRGSLRMRKLLLDLGYSADLERGMLSLDLPLIYGAINPVYNQNAWTTMVPLQKQEILTYGRLLAFVRSSDEEFKRIPSSEYACTELDCTAEQ